MLFKILYDILTGLYYIHSEGFIHGGLKPSNILINEFGNIKLSGFSLSCPIQIKKYRLL